MAKDLRATRDYMRDKRVGTLDGRRWVDYKNQYTDTGHGFEKNNGNGIAAVKDQLSQKFINGKDGNMDHQPGLWGDFSDLYKKGFDDGYKDGMNKSYDPLSGAALVAGDAALKAYSKVFDGAERIGGRARSKLSSQALSKYKTYVSYMGKYEGYLTALLDKGAFTPVTLMTFPELDMGYSGSDYDRMVQSYLKRRYSSSEFSRITKDARERLRHYRREEKE